MNEIQIRLATIADAEVIADISRQTFYETFGFLNTRENMDKFMSEQFNREKLIEEVGEPENIFLLAFDGATAIGYVRLREGEKQAAFGNKDAIEIARIYVINSSLGTGVGKDLMRESIFIAKEMKKDVIWLGVWEKNPRAIAFYTKWGFEKFDEHPFLLGDDKQNDWLMKKELQ
jgi:diamine N-acetyltransferase